MTVATIRHFPQERYPALEEFLRGLALADIRFVPGGRDPATGLDCAGLVLAAFKRVGGTLQYTDRVYRTYQELQGMTGEPYLEELEKSFEIQTSPVLADPEPGDLLLYRMDLNSPVSHAGFLLADGQVCSIYNARSVCLSLAFARYWRERFYGYAAPKAEVFA